MDALCRFSAQALGCKGPMATVSTACSSSAKVFLTAQRWIDAGVIDAAWSAAPTACACRRCMASALQLLSTDICRPFDAAAMGISIGEAAGFMLVQA
jgi:3-oxoacyl-[acyl-carrier-protein] synthase-1